MHRSFISATVPGRRAVAIRTFSIAVSELNRLCCWKMNPMLLAELDLPALVGAASGRGRGPRGSPLCIRRRAPIRVSRVDLPEPDGPGHDHHLAPADLQVVVEEDLGPGLARRRTQ